MRWTHLKPADARRMPWRNGLGATLELALEPPGATLEGGFQWRLSTAEVGASGPFSAFPGLERWLLLLDGAGFSLDFGPRGCVELTEPLVPIRFPGDWPAVANLVDGPSTDLGLIVDPRSCRAQVESRACSSQGRLDLPAGTSLLFVARGTLCVPSWGLHLGQGHLLRVDGDGGALQLVPGYGGAWLVSAVLEGAQPETD